MRERLLELLERFRRWPHAPPGATPAQVAAYASSTLPEGSTAIAEPDWQAAAVFYETPWDTARLGVRAGRLVVIDAPPLLAAEALAAAREAGFGYLVSRVDANDLAGVQALEATGFRMVDAILSQYLWVPDARPGSCDGVRPARADDAAALGDIADLSFTQSRFHDDPWIGVERARRFYREWAEGLPDRPALALVAERGGRVVGFLSCADMPGARAAFGWGYGRIELVAVHPDARGQGVVGALTSRLIAEAPARGWSRLGIGTQLGNLRALRAYSSVGFAPGDAIFTLRWVGPPS